MTRPTTTADLYTLAQRPNGVSCAEAREALGMEADRVSRHLRWMVESGRIKAREARDGRTRTRYYAGPESLATIEAIVAAQQEARRKANVIRGQSISRGLPVAATAVPCKVTVRADGVRVTVAKPMPDRYATTKAPKVFGSLAAGNYLPGESWAARAYGGGA